MGQNRNLTVGRAKSAYDLKADHATAGQVGPIPCSEVYFPCYRFENSLFLRAGNCIRNPDCIGTTRDFRSIRRPSFAESCARRDAAALEALFADTLGEHTVLLTDSEATRAGIEREFAKLSGCDPEDTVVIAFSGHGSETHELVTFDTDLRDLPNTAIPLDLVQNWFSRIPAKRLVFFLDCCFSGGFGAKVLHVDAKPRDMRSTDARLAQLAGAGRIVFTASTADEPAYEHTKFGHGFLTYFLLEALRGAKEVVSGGKISLYRVLSHVTERVAAAAVFHPLSRVSPSPADPDTRCRVSALRASIPRARNIEPLAGGSSVPRRLSLASE